VPSELNIGLSFEHLDFNFKNEHLADPAVRKAIANFGWVGNPFAISSSQDIYRTGGGGNYGAYESGKVDDLFAQAVREVDEARSAELGNQIDQQLTADMATIPLYAKPTHLAVRDRFANVGDNATQEGPFWNSGLWAQKAA
jgi:peptide/nickel transport system substrate-binding protein